MSWTPKLKARIGQCASCPFLKDNNKEWLEICDKLRVSHGIAPGGMFNAWHARYEVMKDVLERGDFACHHSVYDPQMNMRDQSDHRQCPGATTFYDAEGSKKKGGI